jgi:formate hydrogenlyase subunit 6/NADH:ubiquinone oxidoreductase subunit I
MKKPGKMIAEVLRHVLKKPATSKYPFEKAVKPAKFRGKLVFHADKCIGCRICMKDCPAKAITINKVGEKQFEAIVDLDKCIYCAQCVDSCPKKALEASPEFELAALDHRSLKVKINVTTEPEKNTAKKSH